MTEEGKPGEGGQSGEQQGAESNGNNGNNGGADRDELRTAIREVLAELGVGASGSGNGPAGGGEGGGEGADGEGQGGWQRSEERRYEQIVRDELARLRKEDERDGKLSNLEEQLKKIKEQPPRQFRRVTRTLWGSPDD